MADQGVNTGSTASSYDTYVIFCVGNDIAREAAFRSYAIANGIGFKSLYGSYKGVQERSFIVNYDNMDHLKAFVNAEESVLVLGPMRNFGGGVLKRPATLVYADGREERIGHLTEVGRDTALAQEAWTFDPSTGKYWLCK